MTNNISEEIKNEIINESVMIFEKGIKKIPQEQLNELYKQFCRLSGYGLSKSPIDSIIDKATGLDEKIKSEFAQFLMQYVFMPLINQFYKEEND